MDSHHLNPANTIADVDDIADTSQNQLAVAFEISKLLNCGLDKETLSLCMGLLEQGVNPEALADVIIEIRAREAGQGDRNEGDEAIDNHGAGSTEQDVERRTATSSGRGQ